MQGKGEESILQHPTEEAEKRKEKRNHRTSKPGRAISGGKKKEENPKGKRRSPSIAGKLGGPKHRTKMKGWAPVQAGQEKVEPTRATLRDGKKPKQQATQQERGTVTSEKGLSRCSE